MKRRENQVGLFSKKNKKKKEEFEKYEPSVEDITKQVIDPSVVEEEIIEEKVIEEKVIEPKIIKEEKIKPKEESEPEVDDAEELELKRKLKIIEDKKKLLAEQKKLQKQTEQIISSKISSRIMVVKELPEAPIRKYQDKDGSEVNLITIEEALSEILSRINK